jgi:parallel beta-helix repeat protein
MKRKISVITIFILLIGVVFIPHINSDVLIQGTTLYVGGSGPGNYTTIQSAIDDANTGNTVFIYNGVYEENIIVNKTINVKGEEKNNTILKNTKDIEAILVTADSVNISDILIDNTDKNSDGINIFQCSGCLIQSVKIIRCYGHPGIIVKNSDHTSVFNNSVSWSGGGISIIKSEHTTVTGNHLSSNNNSGLYLSQSISSYISNNKIYWNAYEGIYMFGDNQDNFIVNNTFYQNLHGIYMHERCPSNLIYKNTFDNNDIGIQLHAVHNNSIFENDITNNAQYGLRSISDDYHNTISKDNIIYHNRFINNSKHAYDEGINTWDKGNDSWGNYWDDYTGVDVDGNGIGDTPYEIPGGDNKDFYPLSFIGVRIIDVSSSFGKIKATIKTADTAINCSILIDGLVLIGEAETSNELAAWTIETIETPFTFGFFEVNIIVTADKILRKYNAFLFGPFFINFKETFGILT